jgi:hypothetical protein
VADGERLFGDRHPDVQSGAAVGADPAGFEPSSEGLAAPIGLRGRRAHLAADVRVGEQLGDDLLKQAADPAGRDRLAGLDAADRARVGRDEGQPEVRAQ